MPVVSFLRHGATAWNEHGRMQGRRDVPLSDKGRDQVAAWTLPADAGMPIEWVASPLSRAVATATLLGGVAPRIEPALIEMDWGAWEGYRLAELRGRFGVEFERNEHRGLDFRPPGGESPRDVVTRITRWLDSIANRDGGIVAVTHNGVLRALLAIATGWDMLGKPPVRLQSATVHRFVVDPGPKLSVLACNVPLRAEEAQRRAGEASSYPA
jgi:probable phosphoglycerate mutase